MKMFTNHIKLFIYKIKLCIFVQIELAPHDIMYIEICAYTIFYCQFHVVKVDIMSRG